MYLFMLIAAAMVIVHVIAALQRPRIGIIVSGVVWLLYAVYEYYIVAGVLCDANCNIRVDLVLFLPILAAVTFAAYESYEGRQGAFKVVGLVLGIVGLLVVALMMENYKYGTLGTAVVLIGALALWRYRKRARRAN